jgi:hypothetical protein
VQGGPEEWSGNVSATGTIGNVTIRGSIRGGAYHSGSIEAQKIGMAKIKGDIRGGQLYADYQIGPVTVGGSLIGSSGRYSGSIYVNDGNLASVSIGGSVIGGSDEWSGYIYSDQDMGALKIAGDLLGGSAGLGESLDRSGGIEARTRIARVSIGGSVIAGTKADPFLSTLTRSGSIRAGYDVGPITVKGSLVGNAWNPVVISAVGQATPDATDLAIKSLTIKGRVEYADILAGYATSPEPLPVNADAQIGAVTVGGGWIASNLVAGVDNGADNIFGTDDDFLIAEPGGGIPAIFAKIASVSIKGQAMGTPTGGGGFGIVSEQIGSFSVGGTAIPLAAGAGNDLDPVPIGATGNLWFCEV